MAAPAGLLLDLDGTLLDTEPLHVRAHQAALAEFGLVVSESEIHAWVGGHDDECYRRLQAEREVDGDIATWLARKRAHLWQAVTAGPVPPRPGALALVQWAQAAGVPACVVTNSERELATTLFATSPLGSLLPQRVCFEDTLDHKPAPAPYLLGAERIGRDPSACWAIEDSVPGVQAAAAAGARTIAVAGLVASADLAAAGADAVVASLEEVLAWLN